VNDAAAHAENAITRTLRETRDGRPSLRRVTASPSYRAAASRLDELRISLVGPAAGSLRGVLRDAREAFYCHAFDAWRPYASAPHYKQDVGPSQEGINTVRGAPIHGRAMEHDISPLIVGAKRDLLTAVGRGGHSEADEQTGVDLIESWRRRVTDTLGARCAALLSDSQIALFFAVENLLQSDTYRAQRT
jgi:hypothetical protein